MKRLVWILALGATPFLAGCNNGSTASNDQSGKSAATTPSGNPITPAAEVVAQFLDSFRKGDEVTAGKLLTQAAIEEIKKCGLELAPPGSPDSSFEMGKTEYTDEDKDTAYVEIAWTEPVEGAQQKKRFEALFAVRLENNAWRIAGMVIENDPGADPEVIDFENLSQNLADNSQQPPATMAGAPGQPLSAPGQPLQAQVPNQFQQPQQNPPLQGQPQQGNFVQQGGQFAAPQNFPAANQQIGTAPANGQQGFQQNFQPGAPAAGQPTTQLAQPPAFGQQPTVR